MAHNSTEQRRKRAPADGFDTLKDNDLSDDDFETNGENDLDAFDDDGDDGEEEGDEYEVERVVGHMRDDNGELSYLLKWQGYGEADNTWEKNDSLSCAELISQYWSRYEADGGSRDDPEGYDPKPKSRTSTKRGANASSSRTHASESLGVQINTTNRRGVGAVGSKASSSKSETSSSKSQSYEGKRGGRAREAAVDTIPKKQKTDNRRRSDLERDAVKDSADSHGGDYPENPQAESEWRPPSWWTSWEDHLDRVQTVERSQRAMIVHLAWKNGKETEHPIEDAHKKCPQKLIQFYESHLRFTQV
ncbi:hypothetical protein EDD11_005421 [Mortierella claussenii]|nr:hypothetical protein EDD11_005421 [Mortierella claussenii]